MRKYLQNYNRTAMHSVRKSGRVVDVLDKDIQRIILSGKEHNAVKRWKQRRKL